MDTETTVFTAQLAAFKELIRRDNFLVLDTETTGLERGEIVQIAVIEANGATLIDTLVCPVGKIPADATAIHGIRDIDVMDALPWQAVTKQLERLLSGRDLVIYNAVYDRKMMHQSAEAAGLPKVEWKELARFHCAMEMFAIEFGEFNEYRGTFRWQKLVTAARWYGIDTGRAHSALADAWTTLAVVKAMARDA